ncbi:MAG: hypothetical protein GX372_05955 [Ignavibacteria bacterium]|jgi:hypothetical protein|nr:hypothetical protein [Ignavibacteria bacterium]
MQNKLSKYEIEALIPDYIFGNLTEEERTMLEISIIDYPDLQKELQDGIELFDRIDKMDFDAILAQKTDYLPERVVNNLMKRNIPVYELKKKKHRFIMPFAIAATAAFLYFVFNPSKFYDDNGAHTFQDTYSNNSMFTELEKNIIYDEFVENEYLPELGAIIDKTNNRFDENNYFEEDEEIYNFLIEEEIGKHITDYMVFSELNYELLLEKLENMSEEDFSKIMDNIQ